MLKLKQAATDARYLVDRGYPKGSAIRFVSDHYRLPQEQRFVLMRVVVPASLAIERRAKRLSADLNTAALQGKALFVDGYNVLIAVESMLKGHPVYQGDDGFLRDTQGVFRGYRPSDLTVPALSQILEMIASAEPSRAEVIFDQQISMSGRLAGIVRRMMAEYGISGTARTARDVDHQLKSAEGVIATGDGNIIDAISCAVDVPAWIAIKMGIRPQSI